MLPGYPIISILDYYPIQMIWSLPQCLKDKLYVIPAKYNCAYTLQTEHSNPAFLQITFESKARLFVYLA